MRPTRFHQLRNPFISVDEALREYVRSAFPHTVHLRTCQSYYRQMRLVHKHCETDPESITEECEAVSKEPTQLRDYSGPPQAHPWHLFSHHGKIQQRRRNLLARPTRPQRTKKMRAFSPTTLWHQISDSPKEPGLKMIPSSNFPPSETYACKQDTNAIEKITDANFMTSPSVLRRSESRRSMKSTIIDNFPS